MNNLVIIFLLLLIPLLKIYSQEPGTHSISSGVEEKSLIKLEKKDKITLFKDPLTNLMVKSEIDYRNYIHVNTHPQKPQVNNSFNIISSFRKNIHFGGFWEGYAIINFTPDVFIQPLDFVSIYASHNYSNYVPVSQLKENIKMLLAEGAAILAIDNAAKFLFTHNQIIQSVVNFTLKNIMIGMIKSNKKSLLEFKHYFYSVRIRF